MAVQPAEPTQLLALPEPGENSDPFIDQFRAYSAALERVIFFNKIMMNMTLFGGGTKTWDAGNVLFMWTDDFIIPVPHWGRKITVQFGPSGTTRAANIANGAVLYVTVPAVISTNVTRNFEVTSQLGNPITTHDRWVVAWNVDGTLRVRNFGVIT